MKKFLMALLVPVLILCGCTRIDEQVAGQPRVVIKITAEYDSGAVRLSRQYTDTEKMQAVLTYIRCLKPYGSAATDPETLEGSHARLTLHFSDNTTKVYDQRSDQYLRVNDGSWQNIKPERGQELALLLGLMESDP